VNKRKGTWEGSMTELDTEVFTSKAPSTWPKSPALLRVALNRSVKMLRENGLRVVFERKSGSMGGKRVARFEKR
jgi:hypothetical protein